MALNTLKARADEVIKGGFKQVDELRRTALELLREGAAAAPPGKRETGRERIKRLENELMTAREQLMLETARSLDVMRLAQKYAIAANLQADFDREIKVVLMRFAGTLPGMQ